ncbi:metallophosphoesterase [Paenibacillus assamensis]|uniref:metallophosphoesterase n=1 Tax=Paenibacillus assamensis TaxID=311244 RepID=UPI0006844F13|nr:metallophosphoesterase [Paenibacillus assamensis]
MRITKEVKKRLHNVLIVLFVLILFPFHVIGAASANEQPVETAVTPSSEVIAQWNFTSAGTQGIIPASSGVNQQSATIRAIGGPYFEALVSTDNSIKYQGWHNGANTKYWLATLSTKNYENITLSSQQTSTGTGPRDFKVQISADNQSWTDIPNGALTLITSNFNCTNCKLQDIPLNASNQDVLYIRWLVTSTKATNSSNAAVGPYGSSLFKDVIVKGTPISGTNPGTPPVPPKLINMTFNGDPKTSLAFAWYTDVMTDTVVQVVQASAVQGGVFPENGVITYQGSSEKIGTYVVKGDRATQKKTYYYAHKAIANNLTPGTAYKFRVGNGAPNSWSQIGSFTTDAAGNQPYHFIAGSDSQASSRSGFEPWADTFKKAKIQIGDPKFLINVGDLVDNGDLEEQWQWMLGLAQNELTTVPFVPVLGGHEVQDYTGDETTPNNNFYNHFNLPKQVVAGTEDGSVYSFEYGNALYIIFNSQYEGGLASNGSVQWVDQQYLDQVKWMKNVVAKSNMKWKFVALHKAPYGAGDNSGKWEDKRIQFYKKHLVPAFDEMGIDMVFEAHDHMYMRSFQMYNDQVVPASQITLDSEGNAINPKGTIYLMSNAFGNKFYTKYPGYNDYFAAKNLQPFKKMFTDVYVSDQVLKFTAYTAAIADEGSGNNGVRAYDQYGIRRTDVKPGIVTNASVVRNGNKAVISWSPPAGSTEPVRGFRLYEKNDKVSTHWSEYIPVVAGKTQYSFTVNNINSTMNYEFVIKAVGTRLNSDPVEVSTSN